MANEQRIRGNLVSGTLSVGLSNVDTTMNAAGLANLPAVTSAGHAVIVCENEIMYVTAHTASATTATILRAQEGTVAASHAINIAWVHGAVVSDYDSVLGYAQVVAAQTGITTATDLTSLTATVTVPYAGHRVRITADGAVSRTVADGTSNILIMEGATQLQAINVTTPIVADPNHFHGVVVVVPTAASHTYKLQLIRSTGTGTTGLFAAANQPASILVEDLGPAL